MPLSKFTYGPPSGVPSPVLKQEQIEYGFIVKLQNLKYEYRTGIRGRASLERTQRNVSTDYGRTSYKAFYTSASVAKFQVEIYKANAESFIYRALSIKGENSMKATNFAHQFASSLITFALVVGGVLVVSPSARAATGKICAQYGTTTQGSYTIMNNRWGTGATQCINVTPNGFQIVQQDGRGNLSGAPVSYPAIYIGCHYGNCSPGTNLPMKISAIGSAQTSVSLTYPGSGTYNAAYDIWLNADKNVSGVQDTEIMIWLNHTGSIRPIGSKTGTVKLGGRSWSVWVGNNGANNVVSYQGSGMRSFSADLKPFILDAITRGSGFGTSAWYLTSIQMGFEPWVSGVGLAVNSFSARASGGGSNPTAIPLTPVRTPTRTSTSISWETATPTAGPTASGSTCSPVTSTIKAPFVKDGAGTFCWKASTLANHINSWNVKNLKVNGVNYTNKWAATGSLPAKINGFWYISYSSSVPYGHFEAK